MKIRPLPRLSNHFGAIALLISIAGITSPAMAATDDSNVERGHYLSIMAGCSACHTAPDGEPYAGGTVLNTPFGKLAAPNITPDPDTGIGSWSAADFEAALRQGKNRNGDPLYPAMPYMHYTKITDSDIDALWAYVKSLKLVKNEVEVNRLPFPFNVRSSLYVWQELYFEPGRFAPDPEKSDLWNRGAYLTAALGHCGSCHTPRDALGGPIVEQQFKGGPIEEWYAPDISNGKNSVIADWDKAELKDRLSGAGDQNHVLVGSMRDVGDDLSQISDKDLTALVTYLKDQPHDNGGSTTTSHPAEARINPETKKLYQTKCESCHGADGQGTPGIAASLVDAGAVVAEKPYNVISVLLEGIAPKGDYGVMPSFSSISDTEIARLTNYVRSSWGNDAPATATPSMVHAMRQMAKPDPEAVDASVCVNVAKEKVDEKLRARLAELATRTEISSADAEPLVARYDELNPDATRSERLQELAGVLCQEAVKAGAGKSVAILREIELLDAIVNTGTN
ncbi:MAG: c-type cytochrome [Hoeflea sp.]|uniref:c-type cytochrome n=1 Tax=Hoeflea sp. TaxID=1940281 RepID=UPI0032EE501F